jgi:hypothetical protein
MYERHDESRSGGECAEVACHTNSSNFELEQPWHIKECEEIGRRLREKEKKKEQYALAKRLMKFLVEREVCAFVSHFASCIDSQYCGFSFWSR